MSPILQCESLSPCVPHLRILYVALGKIKASREIGYGEEKKALSLAEDLLICTRFFQDLEINQGAYLKWVDILLDLICQTRVRILKASDHAWQLLCYN
jgi:hypothetical protein